MIYRNKLVLLFSFITLVATLNAQVGSPYSQFGFGDNQSRGFERSKAMGGMGIALSANNQLNNLNPASYVGLDSLSTIYSIGLNTGFNNIESSIDNLSRSDTRFGYFALGFKGNRYWGSSFGLMPATSVDYTYMITEYDEQVGYYDNIFYGTGGINKFYWSNAFQLTPNLSMGINASYMFGKINKVTTIFFTDEYFNSGVESSMKSDHTKVKRKLNVYDFSFDYGIQYKFDLKDKSNLVLGAVYQNKTNLKTKRTILGGTVTGASIDDNFYKDIYSTDNLKAVIDTTNIKGEITLPHSFGLGVTYSHKEKLVLGADVVQEFWSAIDNELYNATYNNLLSFRGGLEYTPDFNSVNSYFKRINYRFGGHYTQSHLQIKDTRINDFGISFGLGFPVRNTKTAFSISGEFGQRGTLDQNLLKETYGIISLNISLSDIWFVKRKFK